METKDLDALLEYRLYEWAQWVRTGNSIDIGYPKQSTLMLIKEGKSISKQKRQIKYTETNEEAEEMEKLVQELALYKKILADCLRSFYMEELSMRSHAKKLGISHTQYKLNVQMARVWLVGRFQKIQYGDIIV